MKLATLIFLILCGCTNSDERIDAAKNFCLQACNYRVVSMTVTGDSVQCICREGQ